MRSRRKACEFSNGGYWRILLQKPNRFPGPAKYRREMKGFCRFSRPISGGRIKRMGYNLSYARKARAAVQASAPMA
jgi:hypothetical protein